MIYIQACNTNYIPSCLDIDIYTFLLLLFIIINFTFLISYYLGARFTINEFKRSTSNKHNTTKK